MAARLADWAAGAWAAAPALASPYQPLDFGRTRLSAVSTPLVGAALYLLAIFSLRAWMAPRDAMKLKWPTFVHNVFLCALSVAMCLGTLVELGLHWKDKGFMSVVCDRDHSAMRGRMGLWMYVFYASKYYELLDTVIMVLKKRSLNFLHVYHHCIVMPLFWVYMQHEMAIHWILVVANSFVHVFMYYYYACATLGKTVWWKKYITLTQIIQFVVDLTATWPFPMLYYSAGGCSGSMKGWLFGQAVGCSFFKLFSDFYRKSYRRSNKTQSSGVPSADESVAQKPDEKLADLKKAE